MTAADVRRGQEKDEVEWPPHPDRLFSALVQAWGDLGERAEDGAALEWLQELQGRHAPWIHCGRTMRSHTVTRYVPVNDEWNPVQKKDGEGEKVAPVIEGTAIGRNRQPRRIATAPLSEDTVTMWWPEKAATGEQRARLGGLARAVASLGHSSSLVSVEVLEEGEKAPAPVWVPRPDGEEMLRLAGPGRLEALRSAYRAKKRGPDSGVWASYGRPVPIVERRGGAHRDLVIFRLAGEQAPLPLESASRLIGVWRKALLAEADQPVCEAISGHAPGSTAEAPRPSGRAHLALAPLGDVGHRFARSHLLGVAAALPRDLTSEERRACLRAMGRVGELRLGNLGVWRLEPCDAGEMRRGLQAETWRRASRGWASVTPFVFGRYPKEMWGEEAAGMVREACRIAGLPEPEEVRTAPVGWILGAPPAPRFPALASRPGKPWRAHCHVRLVFSEPVEGPVLAGAGRHQGYGLFRQWTEEKE